MATLSTITSRNFDAKQPVELYLKKADGTYEYVATQPVTRGQVTFTIPYSNGEIFELRGLSVKNGLPYTEAADVKDNTPPVPPTAEISPEGTVVKGEAQPGSKVEVKGPNGQPLGTVVAKPDGTYEITLDTPQKNGEELKVTATDAGGTSPETSVIAPDLTPPQAPEAEINPEGTVVSGKAQPGSTVEVKGPNDEPLGTAVAKPDGTYEITLNTPQKNAEELTVTATDAGGTSDPTNVTAPDLTAPDAPEAEINPEGTVVTGKAQPGSTVEVKGQNDEPLGTAVAKPDGSYEITLNTPQKNAEQLTVTATDAGGTSPKTPVTAPDLTAPEAPEAQINPEGTVVTGKAQPGSTVEVRGQNNEPLGTALAKPDGSYEIILNTPQKNAEELTVTATDAGGTSPKTPVTAPDLTPPDAPTADINADGSVVTGTAQPGSTVEVKDPSDKVIGKATADQNGSYTITLDKPQQNGEKLDVTATDAGGISPKTPVTAPVLILAKDDVIQADIDLAYTVSTKTYSETKVFGSLGKFLGIPIFGTSATEINFNVGATQKTGVDITATNFGFKSLFDAVRLTLYKQDANGSWTKVASDKDVGLFNKFFLFFPEQARIKTTDLPEGNYKIIAEDLTAFSFLSKNYLNVKYTTETTSANLEVKNANTSTGNILNDDLTTPGTQVVKITSENGKSVDVPASGEATLVGQYGTMKLKADGSYSYTPNKNLNAVGQVDEFSYTIKDHNGNTSTAKIYVQIGTDEVKLDWNPNDPSQPAKTLKLVDDVDTVQINSQRATQTSTENVNSGELAIVRNSTSTVASNDFTVAKGDESTVKVSIKASYDTNYWGQKFSSYQDPDDTTFSWQLQKLNTSTGQWENVPGSAGSQYFDKFSSSMITGCVLLNANLSIKEAGQYRVQFGSKTGTWGDFSKQEFDTDVVVTTKHVTDNWVQDANGYTSGNIFTGIGTDTAAVDNLGVFGKKLSISVDGGQTFVDVNAATTVQGTSGKLVISANGDYTYAQTNANPVQDNFVYKVTTATGETATANLTLGFENTVKGTAIADTISSGAIQHVLELGTGADTVKFTALNTFEADIWTDFSKADGDKIDVSTLLSGKGVNAQNISDFISVEKNGTASIIKIDLDGKGSQHSAQDLEILEKNQLSLDELLQSNHLVF